MSFKRTKENKLGLLGKISCGRAEKGQVTTP